MQNNIRIMKNALLLYFRMFLTMAISLYTSRVILDTLGVEDFGIYNVVGGVVVMFSFLTSSMGSATSRFLSYSIGVDAKTSICQIFSISVYIHLLLAIVILLLSETIGLWFLENKLVIPSSKMYAAKIVYQCSVVITLISIMRVPFDALIITNEKFDFFAKIEVLNVILRLFLVFVIAYLSFDKLILYSYLVLCIVLIIAIMYACYVFFSFKEIRLTRNITREQLMGMLTFSSWDLYGNMSVMLRTQGVNMILNMFFGAIINAASGIATQVQSAVMSFSGNILAAFKPQIIKQYSIGNYKGMCQLIYDACNYSVILLYLVGLPILFNIEYILNLWLKNVPDYTVQFCIWTLIFNLGASLSSGVIIGIHATGKIKRPSLINGTLYLLVVPISYLLFKIGCPPYYSFIFNACAVFLGCISNVYTLSLYVSEFKWIVFFRKVFYPLFFLLIIVVSLLSGLSYILHDDLLYLMMSTMLTISVILSLTYFFILDENIKRSIKNKISIKYE